MASEIRALRIRDNAVEDRMVVVSGATVGDRQVSGMHREYDGLP